MLPQTRTGTVMVLWWKLARPLKYFLCIISLVRYVRVVENILTR